MMNILTWLIVDTFLRILSMTQIWIEVSNSGKITKYANKSHMQTDYFKVGSIFNYWFFESSHMGKMLLYSKSVTFFKSENFQLYKTCEKDDGAIAISTWWKSHHNYIKYSS